MTFIREPAVADMFYPSDPVELRRTVMSLLDESVSGEPEPPKALVAPHAGYVYSGPIAASAYAHLVPHRHRYQRVVLLGPCHRVAVRGFALPTANVFRTPLGDVRVDADALKQLEAGDVSFIDDAHAFEHCLEVHLPFLQVALGDFSIVPVLVGNARPERVAELLAALWDGDETLVVISSDLSHYLRYDTARRYDADTCRAIETLEWQRLDHEHACGATPVAGLLIEAARRGLAVETLDLRNSGDTAGDRDAVVGYGAWSFTEHPDNGGREQR